jgi:transcriptional regulator HilA, main transcriptional regulator of SPI1
VTPASFRFDRFCLDTAERSLSDGGRPVELASRYFDALVLLVSEQGRLVAKDRFMDEVWRGIPVTDEALTQCIRTLRRQLGDDASRPRFIETVPKHGYRFIAPVEPGAAVSRPVRPARRSRELLLLAAAGTLGGGAAGAIGGLFYGFAAASDAGSGAISALLVLLAVITAVALVGAAGVASGIATAIALRRPSVWAILGGAAGGLVVGAIVKLLGLDGFTILFGRSPGNITGAAEGLALGGATGLAVWAGAGRIRRSVIAAVVAGAAAGALVAATGGRLMGGSLALLEAHFPGSRLNLDGISTAFGETGFGPVTSAVTAALEAAVFAACVAGAITLARRTLDSEP